MPEPGPPFRLPADCWQQLFGNPHPVALEIGPGRGEFLLVAALADPATNFYAVEISSTGVRRIESKLATAGLTNARVLWADATWLVGVLPPASVATVHVQFPDPWWKRRHKRRRLWSTPFVAALRQLLVPGGGIEFLTDVEEYFHFGQGYLDADPGLERINVGLLPEHDTNFARKALRRGGVIHRSTHRRR
ncbi:MAG: tRNA (guanosine(46)-N7)-methyltransferase TrmB [Candidatus Binatia bacterium]